MATVEQNRLLRGREKNPRRRERRRKKNRCPEGKFKIGEESGGADGEAARRPRGQMRRSITWTRSEPLSRRLNASFDATMLISARLEAPRNVT